MKSFDYSELFFIIRQMLFALLNRLSDALSAYVDYIGNLRQRQVLIIIHIYGITLLFRKQLTVYVKQNGNIQVLCHVKLFLFTGDILHDFGQFVNIFFIKFLLSNRQCFVQFHKTHRN